MEIEREYLDIYLIAALLAYGFEYSSIDSENPKRQKFLFTNRNCLVYLSTSDGEVVQRLEDLLSIEKLYSSRRLLFPATYPDVLKDLKQRIVDNRINGYK